MHSRWMALLNKSKRKRKRLAVLLNHEINFRGNRGNCRSLRRTTVFGMTSFSMAVDRVQ